MGLTAHAAGRYAGIARNAVWRPGDRNFLNRGAAWETATASSGFKKPFDHVRDALDLAVGQFRINRQAQALARRFFRDWKIPSLVTQRRVAFLQVQWQRIMQRAAHAV